MRLQRSRATRRATRSPGALVALVATLALIASALALPAGASDDDRRFRWYGEDLTERWSAPPPPAAPETDRPLRATSWRPTLDAIALPGFVEGSVPLFDPDAPANLIDVWASWCAPCREELPHVEGLWRAYRDRGLHVVAANLGEPADIAIPFVRDLGLSLPVARMPEELAAELDIVGLPVLILADGKGRVLRRWDNFLDGMEEAVAEAVELALDGIDADEEEIARVAAGAATLEPRWSRVAPDPVQGVALLPPRQAGEGARLAVVVQRTLLTVAEDGAVLRRLGLGPAAGQLRTLVREATGDPFLLGFREAGSRLFFVDWSERAHDRWDADVPVFDVELRERVDADGVPGRPEALLATTSGLLRWSPGDAEPRPVPGFETVSAIERARAGWTVLEPGRRLARLDGRLATTAEVEPPAGAWSLVAHPADPGVGIGGEGVVAASGGRMLADAEVAVATRDGVLSIHDVADGRLLHRSYWGSPVLPRYADLDGDGRDELVVVVGNRLTVLAPPAGKDERAAKVAETSENRMQTSGGGGKSAPGEPAIVQKRRISARDH